MLAAQVAEYGVFVFAVAPGIVRSSMTAMAWLRGDTGAMVAQRIPPGTTDVVQVYLLTGTPAEIDRQAAAVIDALAAGKEPPTFP